MISQLSWDQNLGVDVSALPAAIPGQGQRQSLLVTLPDPPAPGAPLLFVDARRNHSPRYHRHPGRPTSIGAFQSRPGFSRLAGSPLDVL